MENIAEYVGMMVIGIILLLLVTAFIQWALYGNVRENIYTSVSNGKVVVNGKEVATYSGKGSVSVTNGTVYFNDVCIYKFKRKFRWQK